MGRGRPPKKNLAGRPGRPRKNAQNQQDAANQQSKDSLSLTVQVLKNHKNKDNNILKH